MRWIAFLPTLLSAVGLLVVVSSLAVAGAGSFRLRRNGGTGQSDRTHHRGTRQEGSSIQHRVCFL